MRKLLTGLMLAGIIIVTGVPVCASTAPTVNTIIETEAFEDGTLTISPRTSSFEVSGTNVNLRKNAGTSSKIVRVLKKGETVSGGTEFIKKDGYTWTWVQCHSDGATGWVATKYLIEIG